MIPRRPIADPPRPAYPTQGELLADARERARTLALVAAAALTMGGCGSTPQQALGGTPPPPQAPAQPLAPVPGEAVVPAPAKPREQLDGRVAVPAPAVPRERLGGDVMVPAPVKPVEPLGGKPAPPASR